MKPGKNNNDMKNIPEKILLCLLPFWSPLIPPIGIAALKSYLKKEGFDVKTVDVAVKENFMELYHNYFDTLKENIPEEKRGNFYSIGHDVLRNQMLAHLDHTAEE
ncbi:MAG: cobalamin B12-binding domain-containing protein, partial [bacterium]|nr:cobalamin B12-binding domain-containing protein [bacterium]